jgi:hypothetical protein
MRRTLPQLSDRCLIVGKAATTFGENFLIGISTQNVISSPPKYPYRGKRTKKEQGT